jgi:hypothetical protein
MFNNGYNGLRERKLSVFFHMDEECINEEGKRRMKYKQGREGNSPRAKACGEEPRPGC